MSAAELLSPRDRALVEAVAARVVELFDERAEASASTRLLNAQELAQRLGVSRATVYARADALGGRRLGNGPKARLRFDLETALEAWSRRSASEGSQAAQSPVSAGVRRRRRPERLGSGRHLLPVKGESEVG